MQLIDNWRKAYKMFSVQAMAIATALQGAWMMLPDDLHSVLPGGVVSTITFVLLILGIIGRLTTQPGVTNESIK